MPEKLQKILIVGGTVENLCGQLNSYEDFPANLSLLEILRVIRKRGGYVMRRHTEAEMENWAVPARMVKYIKKVPWPKE